MAIAILKPREGVVFLQPEENFRRLPMEGAQVNLTPYYAKALLQGDLELVEPEAEAKAQPDLFQAPSKIED